jgi:hypothetical protein
MLESEITERVLASPHGADQLAALAKEVAERHKEPYTAVREIAARAGL